MTSVLTTEDKKSFDLITQDLRFLFQFSEIPQGEIDQVLAQLKSDEVKAYVVHLKGGSKPEVALREAFFAGRSVLSRYLAAEISPEVNLGEGFIDYLITANGRTILLELKSLFETDVIQTKAGRELRELKRKPLKWEDHREQVLRYIAGADASKRGVEYVILTNLRDWYFFNEECGPDRCVPFHSTDFFTFLKDFEVSTNLYERLERYDLEVIRGELDKRFFQSLKAWVAKFSEVEFIDEKRKLEITISLINKFIFVQTLDDYGIIDFRWTKNAWDHAVQRWSAKGKLQVLKEFFREITEWFYEYYDTELFRDDVLKHLKQDGANVDLFYRNLELVLGLAYWRTPLGGFKGIMQYNFKFINEDIFGKAYETFLAEVRKEQGIFYTPKYITEYIVVNTVGRIFDDLLLQIKKELESEGFETANLLVERFKSIRVLDPACGSGSFLTKALRVILERYKTLDSLLTGAGSKYDQFKGKVSRPMGVEEKASRLSEIKEALTEKSQRELISKILVRHIHGIDLDPKALEVAKVNLWLEAIKLAPHEFRFDKLPRDTNHILPDLEMNLKNGDSLVGLPDQLAIDNLSRDHKGELKEIQEFRHQYLSNPALPDLIQRIENTSRSMEADMGREFERYLRQHGFSGVHNETKPFSWPLAFWYQYFEPDGTPKAESKRGFDVVIGNPPYVRIQVLNERTPAYVAYLNGSYECALKNYDLSVIFVERAVRLLNDEGRFAFIIPNKFMQQEYGEKLRKMLVENQLVDIVVNFKDLQVFEDATTYTCLLLATRIPHDRFRYFEVTSLDGVGDLDSFTANIVLIQEPALDSLTGMPWAIYLRQEETLMKNLSRLPKLERVSSQIFVGVQTSADRIYLLDYVREVSGGVELRSRETRKTYVFEPELVRPLLSGVDVERFEVPVKRQYVLFPYEIVEDKVTLISLDTLKERFPVAYGYLLENKKVLENRERGKMRGPNWYAFGRTQNLDKQHLVKLCVPRLVSHVKAFYDSKAEFYLDNVDVGGVTLKDATDFEYQYVSALLNSSLLTYCLSRISTPFRGGFYSCNKQYLSRLPIKMPETRNEKALGEKLVGLERKLIDLNHTKRLFEDLWREWSTRLKTDETSLLDILPDDANRLRKGEDAKAWTHKVTFYPSPNDPRLAEGFADFSLSSTENANVMQILGIDEQGNERVVYEIDFSRRELLTHVYLAMLSALASRSKVNNLSQLLSKSVIPIITPDAVKNTGNIVRNAQNEFEKRTKRPSSPRTASVDLIRIHELVRELEAETDAVVFRLYGLDESEAYLVLQSLHTPQSHRLKVLNCLKKI